MEMTDFIRNFAAQFEKTDKTLFLPDTIFGDLDEWSSLVALSVVAMIDEEYGVSLSAKDFKGVRTIGQLFELVSKKLSDK